MPGSAADPPSGSDPGPGEVLVDSELLVAGLDEAYGKASATLAWSMTRKVGSSPMKVVASGREASILAGDLRFDLLTDPVKYELTRGVTVTVHAYDTVEASTGSAESMLRQTTTKLLADNVVEHCYRLPE